MTRRRTISPSSKRSGDHGAIVVASWRSVPGNERNEAVRDEPLRQRSRSSSPRMISTNVRIDTDIRYSIHECGGTGSYLGRFTRAKGRLMRYPSLDSPAIAAGSSGAPYIVGQMAGRALLPSHGLPCKLSRASGPRNLMKIASIQVIIENGWEWRDRNDSGAAKAEVYGGRMNEERMMAVDQTE